MQALDSYAAEEGPTEVEVVLWSCPRCGARAETSRPVSEPAPA